MKQLKFIILWISFNLILVTLLLGLFFEIIREGYSWYWFFGALTLIALVNYTITSDKINYLKISKQEQNEKES